MDASEKVADPLRHFVYGLGWIKFQQVIDQLNGEPLSGHFTNDDRHNFMGMEVEDDQQKSVMRWMYVQCQDGRMEMVRKGDINMRQTFTGSESGYVYIVSYRRNPNRRDVLGVDSLPVNEIPEKYLPKWGLPWFQ